MSENNTLKTASLILASGSKFRKQLLSATGAKFSVKTSNVDEKKILAEGGANIAIARAVAKSKAVAESIEEGIVIGADQTLSFGGKVYDKAESEEEARERLTAFSGNTHHLHSAVVVYLKQSTLPNPIELGSFIVDVPMTMKKLTDKQITNYLSTNEWKGCVGCYQAENVGSLLFESIGGDNTSVIGLPIPNLSMLLAEHGIDLLDNPEGPWEVKY